VNSLIPIAISRLLSCWPVEKVAMVSLNDSVLVYDFGGVGERFNPPVLKTGAHFVGREFKSRPLRQLFAPNLVMAGISVSALIASSSVRACL
jgi:hypothetical protein